MLCFLLLLLLLWYAFVWRVDIIQQPQQTCIILLYISVLRIGWCWNVALLLMPVTSSRYPGTAPRKDESRRRATWALLLWYIYIEPIYFTMRLRKTIWLLCRIYRKKSLLYSLNSSSLMTAVSFLLLLLLSLLFIYKSIVLFFSFFPICWWKHCVVAISFV